VDVEGIRRVPLLAVLPPERLAALAPELPARPVAPGQVLARAGDVASQLIVVEQGTLVAAHDTREGMRVRLSTVVAPCVVDKVATLAGGAHTATWTAATSGRVRLLSAATLRLLVDEVPAVRDHVLRYLAGEVNRHRHVRVRSADRRPAAQVADWLVEASRRHGPVVRLPGGQQGLGEELGLSRVTVNRALQALARAGVVRLRPGRIEVLDAGAVNQWWIP
jgi:CRP/FNR family transcriptional regulator, cyclic AMP receptor protein